MIIMKICVGEQTYYSKGISFKHSFSLQIRWVPEGRRHNKNGGSIDNGWEERHDINPVTLKNIYIFADKTSNFKQ